MKIKTPNKWIGLLGLVFILVGFKGLEIDELNWKCWLVIFFGVMITWFSYYDPNSKEKKRK
jgi:hypothetical protein